MSSANRTPGLRDANDNYSTPPWCVERLLEYATDIPLYRGDKPAYWLDPCAGEGRLISAANAFAAGEVLKGEHVNMRWHACELRPACEEPLKSLATTVVIGDFLRVVPARYDVVLTNPPYSLAEEFVRACVPIATRVAMLLRVNWIAGHGDLLREHPADILVLPDRPSFSLNKHGKVGADSTEYAWFYWNPDATERGYGRVDVLSRTPVAVRSAYRRELFERLTKEAT